MPLSYQKLFALLETKHIAKYKLVKDKVVGGATLDKLMGKQPGHIDTRTLESLCKYLSCQPGDILEYIPDDSSL